MYRKKRNLDTKYIVLIFGVVFILLLGLIFTSLKDDRKLNPIEKITKDTVLMVQKVVFYPFSFIKEKVIEYQEKENLYKKYITLKEEQQELDLMKAKNEELQREIKQMKELLELNKTLEETSYISATVINRNIGYWHNTLTIDKGEIDGIKEDMPVIVGNGLIGKVIKTSYLNSTVKLLTSEDINNKISVRIQRENEFFYGLLTSYNPSHNTFIVEGIDTNKEILIGDVVTTTGLGDIFPSGILIGEVSNITTDSFDLAKTLEVTSKVDFNDISFVTVLKRDVQ